MKYAATAVVILLLAASAVTLLGPITVLPEPSHGLVFYSSDSGPPHSVILMVGDGMGFGHVQLGSWVEVGKAANLTMATLGHSLSVTTYSADSAITDSAAAATAMATGHKTNNGRLSIDPGGLVLDTILEIAQGMNKSTGIVTTTAVRDATPAAFMTHVLSRTSYSEIIRQIVEDSRVEVILGGGLTDFSAEQLQTMQSNGYAFVTNRTSLLSVSSERILGLFDNSNLPYEQNRNYTSIPSLAEMAGKAIDILSADSDGFFLIVEGGLIDKAAHVNGKVDVALETIAFDKAVSIALNYVRTHPTTMLIVVADHETGGLSITADSLGTEIPLIGNTEEYNRSLRIERSLNVTTSWAGTGHTPANVPLFQQGQLPEGWTNGATIHNTDIFDAMSAHLSLDIPHELTAPDIVLNSPANDSVVKPFTSIDLNITDESGVDVVLYHWDAIANDTLTPPYDLAARTSEVAHWLYVYANDTYNNWASAVFVFTSDSSPPSITLFTPPNDTVHYSGVTVAVNVSDDHLDEILYRWDNEATNTTWIAPYETTLPAGDGEHTIHVQAYDSAGNVAERVYVFYTNDGAPMITLQGLPNGSLVRSGLELTVTVMDQELDTVLYAWDNVSDYVRWSAPFETLVPSGKENPVLFVWANNSRALVTETHYQFIVDDLQPQITLVRPANLSICVGGTEVTLDIFDEHLASVLMRWDDTVSNSTWSSPYVTNLPSSDGFHTLAVYAFDSASNSWSVEAVFEVDNIVPAIILITPSNSTVLRSEVGVLLNISDLHFSHAWIAWDSGPIEPLEYSFSVSLPLTDGWHLLSVTANDSAGNTMSTLFVWTIDNTPPVINSQSDVVIQKGDTRQNVTWKTEEVNPAHYQVLLNGSLWSSGLWNSSSEPFVILLGGFDVGVYNLTLILEDLAGNRASSIVLVFVGESTTSTTSSTTGGTLFFQVVIALGVLAAAAFVTVIVATRYRGPDSGA